MSITLECPNCKAINVTKRDVGGKKICFICGLIFKIDKKTIVG